MRGDVILTNTETGETLEFASASAAALSLGLQKANLSACLTGKRKSVNGWTAKYSEGKPEPKLEDISEVVGGIPDGIADLIAYDSKHKPEKTIENIVVWLENHPKYKDAFRLNLFTQQATIHGRELDDRDLGTIRKDIEIALGFDNKSKVEAAIDDILNSHTFNPVKQMLDQIDWDGESRIEEFFIKYLGADDTHLNRTLTKNWFYGLMKRLYEPGCNWDYMLIAHDCKGGTGKTKIFRRIAKNYIAEQLDISNKDSIATMNKLWIVNFDELSNFGKKEMTNIKTFISQTTDTNRLAYQRNSRDYKRHCVFCGTTNEEYFLRDYTDSYERRFWVMECHGEKHSQQWWNENLPESVIDQVLAEAEAFYLNHRDYDVTLSEEDELALIEVQDRHKTYRGDAETVLAIKQILSLKYTKEELTDPMIFRQRIAAANGRLNSYISDNPNIRPTEFKADWLSLVFPNRRVQYLSKIVSKYGWHQENRDGTVWFVADDKEAIEAENKAHSDHEAEIESLFNGNNY